MINLSLRDFSVRVIRGFIYLLLCFLGRCMTLLGHRFVTRTAYCTKRICFNSFNQNLLQNMARDAAGSNDIYSLVIRDRGMGGRGDCPHCVQGLIQAVRGPFLIFP